MDVRRGASVGQALLLVAVSGVSFGVVAWARSHSQNASLIGMSEPSLWLSAYVNPMLQAVPACLVAILIVEASRGRVVYGPGRMTWAIAGLYLSLVLVRETLSLALGHPMNQALLAPSDGLRDWFKYRLVYGGSGGLFSVVIAVWTAWFLGRRAEPARLDLWEVTGWAYSLAVLVWGPTQQILRAHGH